MVAIKVLVALEADADAEGLPLRFQEFVPLKAM